MSDKVRPDWDDQFRETETERNDRLRAKRMAKPGIAAGKICAGHDFPCALHKGPAGNCQPWTCRCY